MNQIWLSLALFVYFWLSYVLAAYATKGLNKKDEDDVSVSIANFIKSILFFIGWGAFTYMFAGYLLTTWG